MNDGTRILIIEDEFIIALNLQSTLQEQGYNVIGIANSYEESIHLSKLHHPEIAIVDINIDGDIDGIETAGFIKDLFKTSVIFLTAYTHNDYFERAKIIQPEAYLTKPFKNEDVIRAIKLAKQKLSKHVTSDEQTKTNHIVLSTGDGWHKVYINDIIYITSDNNYCTVYLLSLIHIPSPRD